MVATWCCISRKGSWFSLTSQKRKPNFLLPTGVTWAKRLWTSSLTRASSTPDFFVWDLEKKERKKKPNHFRSSEYVGRKVHMNLRTISTLKQNSRVIVVSFKSCVSVFFFPFTCISLILFRTIILFQPDFNPFSSRSLTTCWISAESFRTCSFVESTEV